MVAVERLLVLERALEAELELGVNLRMETAVDADSVVRWPFWWERC